jgi:hypothetical protein
MWPTNVTFLDLTILITLGLEGHNYEAKIYIIRYNYKHVRQIEGKPAANSVAIKCHRKRQKYVSRRKKGKRKNARKETRVRIKELLGSKERQQECENRVGKTWCVWY